MKITIIGWYGTETIGDRAILAGLISFFHKAYESFEIKLGSLYPFFTERTLIEDYSFYKEIIEKEIRIEIFNSKVSKELDKAIKNSDLIAMGGGPLMDLNELFMVQYAFKKAKKLNKKTALLGCGVGPLFSKKHKKSVLNISSHSDLIILRDNKSKENLYEIYREFNIPSRINFITTSYDPAVECALMYNKLNRKDEKKYIAVNLRKFPREYVWHTNLNNIDDSLKDFIKSLTEKYQDKKIWLIPMHYFHIGGDDRIFLNKIALDLSKDNIEVQNQNISLKDTIKVYQNAYFSIGMRFHSVVLQTISSEKNYVLDYTEPKKGKIFGFLSDIDKHGFYRDRYISLQHDDITTNIIQNEERRFNFDEQDVIDRLHIYIETLKEIRK